jgi:DNA invertase Pin-like site-specific DNA recombinase
VRTERDAAVPGRHLWRKTIRRLLSADPPARALAEPVVVSATPVTESARPRRALGYVLCERDAAPAHLAPRIEEIHAWCAATGVALQDVVHDVATPGEQRARPSLQWALAQIADREADTLVVSRLGDLSGSVATLSPLLRWFMDGSRVLVALDLGLDTSTREGQLAAAAVAGVGSLQRERISAGTRRGLEAARSRGGGLGRIAVADVPELHDRIARMREAGMTLQAIADVLNDEGVPTLRGGTMWRPSSVQRATGYRRPPANGGISLPGGTSGFGRLRDA